MRNNEVHKVAKVEGVHILYVWEVALKALNSVLFFFKKLAILTDSFNFCFNFSGMLLATRASLCVTATVRSH